MKKIIQALSQRLILLSVMVALLFVWGIYSASQMKTEYLPQINNPILMVTWKTPAESTDGAVSQAEESLLASLKEVEGLESIQSTNYPQGLFASLTFPQSTNIDQAEKNIQAAVQQVSLPAGASKPEITRIGSDSFPFMEISSTTESGTGTADALLQQLGQIQGIKKIDTTGNGQTGYLITLDNQKLLAHGLRFEDVQNSLQTATSLLPEGKVVTKNLQLQLQVKGTADQKTELENTVIHTPNQKSVLLKDVASVEKGPINVQTLARTNGKPSVILDLYKTSAADVTRISQQAEKKLQSYQQAHPEEKLTVLSNQGQTVSHAINGLWKEGLLGCFFSMLCVFLFFREWRATLAIAFTLPICFLSSVSILYAMGITLNLLTASGLIVAMGRVVDDSIVVLDNMYRRLERNGSYSFDLLAASVKEMVPAVVSSTLTTIAVYLPLTLTGTMVGQAFFGLAWAVTISLVCSLVVSLLVLPPYAAFTWKNRFFNAAPQTERWAIPLLQKAWPKRQWWFGGMAAALVLAAVGAFFLPVNVLPRTHAQDLNIQVEAPEGSTLDQVNGDVRALESLLQQHQEIKTYASTAGSSFTPAFDDVFDQAGGWIQQPNVANVYVTPKPGVNVDQLTALIKDDIKKLNSGAIYTVTNQQIAGDDSRVTLTLSGGSSQELAKAAGLVKGKLQMINGLQIYSDGEQADQMNYTVELNDDKIKALGLDRQAIADRLETFIDKQADVQLTTENTSSLPIELHKPSAVSLSYAQGVDPEQEWLMQLGRVSFKSKTGKTVRLEDIASLNVDTASITSEQDGQPIAVVTGNILTNDIDGVTGKINETLVKLQLPKGIHVEFGGIPQQVEQMIWSISFAGIISILLVVIIISSIFKGIRTPIAVLSSLPFALVGSVALLVIFKQSWNLGALVGLVMLIGIVATNGIVLVDRLERLRNEGRPLQRLILEGTASRVRPIFVTAATTILTLLPLTFSGQSDTLISQSLGLVVVGGMITSTLTSLLVVPTIYHWLWNSVDKSKVRGRIRRIEA
ncbi:efflux RND transporter permease subunit [Heyndrickxia acidicola]|uniref:Efflux RND transporter permease subunit n=1 Tax=Heyndrickxia acidicola TaxID=209389 RepID=A0ABU6MI81_9BACI|nr:efflux RND transporter permease subunit [Heyndrickxia acidicola]MED1204387.1 efflux RND transporter permease subunit [Heyndrickxia acidicola]